MDADHIVRTMVVFGSKALVLSRQERLNKKIGEWEEDYEELKDKYDGAVGELDDLKNSIIQEHINGFEKGLRQTAFFHQDVDVTDSSWTGNPSRYKDMGMDELSADDKEVVEILLKFVDKLPTKGLVRVYNSVHPIIDIEGHMAQSGKKNLALFQSLRKEMAAKAKAAGKTDVPNLQESVVEVHVHCGTKRKVELPPRHGKGKDVKRVRAALLGTGSASGAGRPVGRKDRNLDDGRVWKQGLSIEPPCGVSIQEGSEGGRPGKGGGVVGEG
ncbi:hypothetical protein DEO72_LG2g3608 [Vigna unguiculata]|uniref:Uncharacterized protein n=1 Tax=Vigna unguiculata TaxID=3917 RepID=A0A4D6L484_VIGUN|nr:hypothetical protein DEO72_LG2g3608 [Vigna unguiculata]